MIIDCHAHYVPQALLERLKTVGGRFPSIVMSHDGDSFRFAFNGGPATRPIMPRLREVEQRFAWMDEQGIDRQVVAGWLDMFAYEIPADEATEWSRFLNEQMLEATRSLPRLIPLATVPLQSGAKAALVLREAMAAGCAGAMIGTQPKGASGNLDDPDLDPFWEAAAALKAPIFLHPLFGAGDARLKDYDMINAVGRLTDTTTAVARLLFSGHLLRYPDLRLIISHGGAALPFALGRLVRNIEAHPGQYADPREGFRRLWFDSILFDAAALRYLADKVGAERIMLGSDYPFPIGDPLPRKVVEEARLGAAATRAILGGSASILFPAGGP